MEIVPSGGALYLRVEEINPNMAPATTKTTKQQTTDVAIPDFSDDDFRNLETFEDALTLLTGAGLEIEEASSALGNGFAVLKNKDILVGVPFVAIQWRFTRGDNGEFVTAYVMAKMPGSQGPNRFILNDGGTGIYQALKTYTDKTGRNKGLYVAHGLTRSDYMYTDEKSGEQRPATTYYLDTSA